MGARWVKGEMSVYDQNTALVVVDVQNDFADPSGSLYVAGAEKEVVPAVNREVSAAAAAEPVFSTPRTGIRSVLPTSL